MNQIESLKPIDKFEIVKKLSELRKKINFEIPDQFSNFLENNNVGKPKFTFFKNNEVEFDINYFFGFSDIKYQDLNYNFQTYITRMPSELFPIASVDGGDLLCMSYEDGSIYYWFHEEDDWGLEGNEKWPKKIEDNLSEFIKNLEASEEPTDKELERARNEGKIKKITPFALKLKNDERKKQGLPPLTMEDFS